jgi:hypothetical protein
MLAVLATATAIVAGRIDVSNLVVISERREEVAASMCLPMDDASEVLPAAVVS